MQGLAITGRLMRSSALTGVVASAFWAAVATNANSAESAGGTQVDEVIVHAQRRDESLQRVPVSVTPISGAELTVRKLNDLRQITIAVPSLTIGQAGYYSVRGIGSLTQNPILDSSVGVSVDEVSLGVPGQMSNGILDDVAQVEVLSGPQGLLFGRNASAGLINVITNRPVFDRFEGKVSTEFDDRDTTPGGHYGGIGRATINIPISSTSALRLNLNESYQDPITKIVNPDPPGVRRDNFQHDTGIKAKYLWEPTPQLTLYLIADYNRQRGEGDGAYNYLTYRTNGHGIEDAGLKVDNIIPSPDNMLLGSKGPVFYDHDGGGVSLNIAYKFSPELTISNIAAWRGFRANLGFDFDFTSLNLADIYGQKNNYNQYSDELRATFQPSRLIDGQAGLYVFYQTQHVFQTLEGAALSPNPGLFGSDLNFKLTGRSLAAYSQLTFHATDKLQFLAGARVTNDRVTANLTQNIGNYVIVALGPANVHVNQSFDDTNFSYKVGAQYQFNPSLMAYITYGTGYKGPSFNEEEAIPGQDLTVRPETVKNLEGGLKGAFFDRRLRLNLAAFLEDFKNLQVENFNAAVASYINGNAGRARTVGLEVNGAVKPVDGLTVNFGATIQDAHFTDFPGDPCYVGQTSPVCSPTGSFNGAGVNVPNSAKFTGTLEAIYEHPINGRMTAYVEGNFYHRSNVNYSTNGAPQLAFGDVNTLGMSIGARMSNGLELSIFCKDCNNQAIPSSLLFDVFDQSFAGVATVQQTWSYNSVRTIGVSASYPF